MIGNRDDHLRNHGFIREADGWRLSLAYDMNPNPYKDEHVLAIDEVDPRPNLQALLSTADFYRLPTKEVELIIRQVTEVVNTWQAAARKQGLRRSDIELMGSAFWHAPNPLD